MKVKILKGISVLLVLAMVLAMGVCSFGTVSAAKTSNYKDYIKYRGQDLRNTYAKLKAGEEVNVVYYGGSVTNGTGVSDTTKSWRGLIGQWLVDNFPDATVNNINKSYGGTGSKFGAYRLNHDVIPEKPDLIFVEYSINDHYDDGVEDATMEDYSTRFETIVRSIRQQLPYCDIVIILTTEVGYLSKNLAGELHAHAQEHENICIEYDIPSIHVGRALADEIGYEGDWYDYSGDIVHLNEKGYKVYFEAIKEYFNNCLLNGKYDGTAKKHTVPRTVNNYLLDGDVEYIPMSLSLYERSIELCGKSNWAINKNPTSAWSSFDKTSIEPKSASDFNADLSFALEFTGTEVVMLGHSDGVVAFEINVNGKAKTKVGYDKITPNVIVSGLEYGKHTIVIKPIYATSGTRYIYIQGFFVRNQEKCSARYDHEHKLGEYKSDKNATCEKNGTKTAKCYKKGCDVYDTIVDEGTKLEHKIVTVVKKKASSSEEGNFEKVCKKCGRLDSIGEIAKIKSVKLSTTSYTYNGKTKKPKVIVKDANGKTISDEYYKITRPSSSKKVGKYTIKVKFKTRYSGTVKLTYKINPAKSGVSKVTAAKKSLKVKIKKVSSQATGYEIQYSTSKKFTKSTTKTKTIKSYKTTSVTIKSLKAKKTYYVRVRTYKTVDGKKYYSDWSSYKSKKTK